MRDGCRVAEHNKGTKRNGGDMITCPPIAAKNDCLGCPKKKECKEDMRQYQELQRKIKAGLPKARPWIITEEPVPNLKSLPDRMLELKATQNIIDAREDGGGKKE